MSVTGLLGTALWVSRAGYYLIAYALLAAWPPKAKAA
jgi:hypothetical protein